MHFCEGKAELFPLGENVFILMGRGGGITKMAARSIGYLQSV
jgi:hypothetical protein